MDIILVSVGVLQKQGYDGAWVAKIYQSVHLVRDVGALEGRTGLASKPQPISVEVVQASANHCGTQARPPPPPPQALPLRLSQSPSVLQSLRPSGKSWLLTRLLGSVTLTSSQTRAGSPISAPICCALPPLLRRAVPPLLRREPRFLRETWQREVSGQKAATTAGLVTVAATIHCCPPSLSILSSPRPQPPPLLASVA